MNRNAKGAIAVGAATLLLLGGGGTFALWNSSQTVTSDSVLSGELLLDAPSTGTWYHYADYAADPDTAVAVDIDDYIVVPEDDLIFVTEDATLDATGTNLYYTFSSNLDLADALADGYTVSVSTVDEDLDPVTLPGTLIPAGTTVGTNKFSDGTDVLANGTSVYHITTTGTADFNIALRVTFDAEFTDNQNTPLDLSSLAYVLKQVVLSAS